MVILNVIQNASFFVFSADESKKSVRVSVKYLSGSGRSYLVLLGHSMDYWTLSYHEQDVTPQKYNVFLFFVDSAVFLIFLPSTSHKQ